MVATCSLRVRCIVNTDLAAFLEPGQKIMEGLHRESLSLLASLLVVRCEIGCRLLGSCPSPTIVPNVYPAGAVAEPGEVALELPRHIGLPPGRKSDHNNGETGRTGGQRHHGAHLTRFI